MLFHAKRVEIMTEIRIMEIVIDFPEKGARNIKKFLKVKNLFYSICIAMSMSYLPFAQNSDKADTLWLGFPYKFYSIHINMFRGFAIHFAIGTFILDVFIVYVLYTIILNLIDKRK